MRLSDVSWKNMHPASLMRDVAKDLGTEDPNEFLRMYRTNSACLYRLPGMGRASIRYAVAAMRAAGLDVDGTALLKKILEFLQENSERTSVSTLVGLMEKTIRPGTGDDPEFVSRLFEAALLNWGEGDFDDEHLHVKDIRLNAEKGVISGSLFYRSDKIASAIATAESMEVTKTISS